MIENFFEILNIFFLIRKHFQKTVIKTISNLCHNFWYNYPNDFKFSLVTHNLYADRIAEIKMFNFF